MGARKIAIIGTVGVPANYGGFETLVENLLDHNTAPPTKRELSVYCSAPAYDTHPDSYKGARLIYIPLKANGVQSIAYDIWSLLSALRRGADTVLILGVSGSIALPLVRLFSLVRRARIVTNIDGIEWRRAKWGWAQRRFLKWSEAMALRFSDEVIADNGAISDYVAQSYGKTPKTIAYGGDHATSVPPVPLPDFTLPPRYGFNLCRIEPENNVHLMLEAFSGQNDIDFICVGNWDRSAYGRDLKRRYGGLAQIHILDPIYDLGRLAHLRGQASFYVHGHSAGGTNPSLVEAMQFGVPVLAYDCPFNRHSTEGAALFFRTAPDLRALLRDTNAATQAHVGAQMRRLAQSRYRWQVIAQAYFDLLDGPTTPKLPPQT